MGGMDAMLEQLSQWMETDEDEHLEFKEAKVRYDFEKLVKYCAALANEEGGHIILGVSDKKPRQVVGSRAFDNLERTKAGLIEKLHLRIEVTALQHPHGRVVIFSVPSRPIGMPIQYKGAYWMRGGEDLVPMTPDVLKRIFAEAEPDFSAEICAKANLDDLHPEKIGQETLASFTTDDLLLLDLIHREKPIREELKERLHFLIQNGVIEKAGRSKYILSREFYGFAGKKGTYTRKKGLDRETNKALLLKHIVDNAETGSQLKELLEVLPDLSNDQVRTLLREMHKAGDIVVIGKTKAGKWYPAEDEN